ncbi:MAG: penicillin-binding protein, partial [Muribaculaceae bacterium]|nr:penicillin-binding protein [Muribaculaceae bacterium]
MEEVDKEIQPKPKKGRIRKILVILWVAFVCLIGAIGVFFIMIYNGLIGYMPEVEELKNPKDKFASVLYTADGVEMGRYYDPRTGNRVYADFDEISPYVVDALVSTEDSRYFDHSGIDMRAMGRVFFKTMLMRQKNAGGGSTITQQLAKQLYSPPSEGFMDRALQKPIEWMIAVKLERLYSKDEILKMYLNQFDFLNNAVGIRSAAQVYFGKEPKDLNIQESATLVGMVKNPAIYNPLRNLEGTRQRRNVVLEQMYKADKITKAELDSLQQLSLELNYHRVDHKEGIAPYFRTELKRVLTAKKPVLSNYLKQGYSRQRFVDDSIAWATNPLFGWIEKNPKPDGTKYNLYTDGLKIYTSIDSRMQRYAEEAVTEHLSDLQKRFFKEKKGTRGAPYSTNRNEISQQQVDQLIINAMKQSDRYITLKRAGMKHEDIMKTFDVPRKMEVFT